LGQYGNGWHAHPTQALLDLYTIRQHKGSVNGRKIVIIGDIKHSRVAHSNIWILDKTGARVVLCAPATLLPYGLQDCGKNFPHVEVESNVEKQLRMLM